MKRLIVLILSTLLLCSCNERRLLNAFSNNDIARLQVGSIEQMHYDPLLCQMSFSADRKEFRIQTDNTSDFFVARFSEVPTTLSQKVNADLSWTTSTDVVSRNKLALEVTKIEGNKVWLWSKSAKIGLCIVIL